MQSNIKEKGWTDEEIAMLEKARKTSKQSSRRYSSDNISYIMVVFSALLCIAVVFLFVKVVSSAK